MSWTSPSRARRGRRGEAARASRQAVRAARRPVRETCGAVGDDHKQPQRQQQAKRAPHENNDHGKERKPELSRIGSTLAERDLRGLNARVVAYPLELAGGKQCRRQLRPRAPLRRADTYRDRPDRGWYRAADAKSGRRLIQFCRRSVSWCRGRRHRHRAALRMPGQPPMEEP
jgi:hypothetical protein